LLATLHLVLNKGYAQDRFETPVRTVTITAEGQKWKEQYTLTTLDPTVKEGKGGKLPLTFNIVSDLGQTKNPVKGGKPIDRFRNMQLEFTFLYKYKGFNLSGSDTRKGQLRFEANRNMSNEELSFEYLSDFTIDPSPWLPAKKTELNIMCPDYRQYKLPLKKAEKSFVELKGADGNILYTYRLEYGTTYFKTQVVKGNGSPYPNTYEIKNNSPTSDKLGHNINVTLKDE
jgi:hypothetical protein